jgi:hypothetical protein
MTKVLKFTLFIVYQCAHKYKVTSAKAYQTLDKYGAIDYVISCYNPLHTQGHQFLMSDIEEFMEIRGHRHGEF